MEKLVSVIVPIYNTEKWLIRCFNSLQSQSYRNLEIILVNDGSTDNSLKICNEYANKYENFNVINQENRGVSYSRNTGIKKAKGDFICFVDSDDEVKETFISDMVNTYKKMESDLICTNFDMLDSFNNKQVANVFPKETFFNKEEFNNLFVLFIKGIVGINNVVNKLFNSRIIKKNKIYFDQNISHSEDMKFVLDYLKYCESFHYFPVSNYIYHYNANSLTKKFDYDQLKNHNIWKKIIYDYIPEDLIKKNVIYLNKLTILEVKSYLCNAVICGKNVDYESVLEYIDLPSLIKDYKFADFRTVEEKLFYLSVVIKHTKIFMYLFRIKLFIKRRLQ